MLQRQEIVLVHRVSFFISGGFGLELLFKTTPLIEWIVQLGKGIAHLEPSNEGLESFDQVWFCFFPFG